MPSQVPDRKTLWTLDLDNALLDELDGVLALVPEGRVVTLLTLGSPQAAYLSHLADDPRLGVADGDVAFRDIPLAFKADQPHHLVKVALGREKE